MSSTIHRSIPRLASAIRRGGAPAIARSYFGINWLCPAHAIEMAVDRSTIRAYHGTKTYRPLSIFRSWAYSEVMSSTWLAQLNRAALGRANYDAFHKCLNHRLQQYWRRHESSSVPNYGRARKLTDLLMKHILLARGIPTATRNGLYGLVNVPMDKYTLMHLSGISSTVRVSLPPANWTMGSVSISNYAALQELVRNVTTMAGVAPIVFDIYAWNVAHPSVTSAFTARFRSRLGYTCPPHSAAKMHLRKK